MTLDGKLIDSSGTMSGMWVGVCACVWSIVCVCVCVCVCVVDWVFCLGLFSLGFCLQPHEHEPSCTSPNSICLSCVYPSNVVYRYHLLCDQDSSTNPNCAGGGTKVQRGGMSSKQSNDSEYSKEDATRSIHPNRPNHPNHPNPLYHPNYPNHLNHPSHPNHP